jgi:uroporphyrinogen III methyltransferase/synthase
MRQPNGATPVQTMSDPAPFPAIERSPDIAQERPARGSDPASAQPGTVYLVGAGPGDPELITVRGAALLAAADVVLHDELVHPALLSLVSPTCEVRFVGKRGGAPAEKQARQTEIDAALVTLAREGRRVVRLKGGDPFLFGRGSEEAEVLARASVPFEVVPGVTAALGASAYAGISLTHRDLASSVTIVSGTTRAGAPFDFTEIAGVSGTICVLMGMRRIDDVTRGLIEGARKPPATPAAVIHRGTFAEQRTVTGRLDDIAEKARAAAMTNPALILVGPVVALRETIRWFDVRPLFGKRILVTRAEAQAEGTARLLRRRGAAPIVLPTIVLRDPPDPTTIPRAIAALPTYDLVAFTSENAVSRFFAHLRAGGRDARAFARAKIAAIGPGTAAALAAHGITADIVPPTFVGESLAAAILEAIPPTTNPDGTPTRVLIPRAKVAREILPETLRAAGCTVDILPVYETTPPPPETRDSLIRMLEERTLDIVMLTSSSTADNLCDLLGARAKDLLGSTSIASIGPVTTATAQKRGLTVAVTAEVSTLQGLITAIEAHLAAAPPNREDTR